jgi:hypothetical protein
MNELIHLEGDNIKILLVGSDAIAIFMDFILKIKDKKDDIVVENLSDSEIIRLNGNKFVQKRFIIDFIVPISKINLDSDNVVT